MFGFFNFHPRLDRWLETVLLATRRRLSVEHALSVHSVKLQFKDESEQEQSPVEERKQSTVLTLVASWVVPWTALKTTLAGVQFSVMVTRQPTVSSAPIIASTL
jgi:hypothetical protein